MRPIAAITAVAAVAIAGATLLVPATTAGAAAHCTAYGSLPARVALHGEKVIVRSVLEGSPGCHGQPTDNGASAYLHAPGTSTESLRWRKFGSSQTVQLYASLAHTGTYRITGGNVQVYDSTYRRVDSSWRNTATVVKWAARIDHLAIGSGRVSARAVTSSKFGLVAARKLVYLQRHAVGATTWHTLGSMRPNSQGWVSYATGTSPSFVYRLVFYAGDTTWGATSPQFRG